MRSLFQGEAPELLLILFFLELKSSLIKLSAASIEKVLSLLGGPRLGKTIRGEDCYDFPAETILLAVRSSFYFFIIFYKSLIVIVIIYKLR